MTYRHGASALVVLKASPPDLITPDLEMPCLDGMGMLRRPRDTSKIPVILLISKNDDVDEVLGACMASASVEQL